MSRVFLQTVSISSFSLGRWVCLSPRCSPVPWGQRWHWLSSVLTLVWLSWLWRRWPPVVAVVGAVAAVAALVRVAVVSPLPQPGPDPSPVASVLSPVSRMVFHLPRGLYPPVLGLALAQECCLVLDLASLSVELPPGSPLAESHLAPPAVEFGLDHPSMQCLARFTQLGCLLAFLHLLGLLWLWVFLGLSGSSPALPSWVSSWVAAPWIHPLPHQVLVLGASLVVPLVLPVCLDSLLGAL